jgi:FHS family L-fucose permease-like MFS transporter
MTGFAADMAGLRMSLAVPAICYLLILAFGWYARRPLQNC